MDWQLNKKSHRIEVYNEEENVYADFCEEIGVQEVRSNLLTGRKTVIGYVYDKVTGEGYMELKRRDISKGLLKKLVDYGLSVVETTDMEADLIQIMMECAEEAPQHYYHDKLGFCKIGRETAFLAHYPIGVNDSLKARSEYIYEKTKPLGTFASWKEVVKNEVLGYPYMELALAIGALAPVAHVLREKRVISDIPIVALIGPSSRGKTTSLKLMGSIWGAPEESGGVVEDFNATQNAFFAQMGNDFGFPTIVDDTSSVPDWDFTRIIYNLPKGREKRRCNGDGSVKLTAKYSGAIIFTGENSIFEQTNENLGLLARLLELSFPWTDDMEHSQRIDYGCRWNYGTAVYPLMKWVLENQEVLPTWYREQYDLLNEIIEDFQPETTGVEYRIIKIYAQILVAAVVLKTSLSIDVDVDDMRDLLVDHHYKKYCGKGPVEEIIANIKEQILNNNDKFHTEETAEFAGKIWGYKSVYKHQKILWVAEPFYNQMLQKARVKDIEKCNKLLAEVEFLHKDKQRHYKFVKSISGTDMPCYGIFIGKEPLVKKIVKKNATVYECSGLSYTRRALIED